jgi:hypothetical protein
MTQAPFQALSLTSLGSKSQVRSVLYWFSRRALSWRVSITMEGAFCIEALEDAHAGHGKPEIFNPNARENGQIRPSTTVRAARGHGSGPHLASVLQEGVKSPNIHASLRVTRGIPDNMLYIITLRGGKTQWQVSPN